MKKVLFLSLALLVAGATFADKKCCKDKKEGSCSKEAKASCSKDSQKEGDKASAEMPGCCKKSVAQGKSACCAKKSDEAQEKHSQVAPIDGRK